MRLTQIFFIAAATTAAVHAQTTTTPASSATTEFTKEDFEEALEFNDFQSSLEKQILSLASIGASFEDAYSTYTGISSLDADFSAWVSTRTAAPGHTIPTQLPEFAEKALLMLGDLDLMDEFLKDSGKEYLPKEVQSRYPDDVNEFVKAGKDIASVLATQTAMVFPEITAEADSAANRVGSFGALGVAFVAGIVVVVAL